MYRALQVGSRSAKELKITQLNTTLAVQKLNYVQVVALNKPLPSQASLHCKL